MVKQFIESLETASKVTHKKRNANPGFRSSFGNRNFYLCIRFPEGNMWVKTAHYSRSRNNKSLNMLFYVTFEITAISNLHLASEFTDWQNRGKLKGHLSLCVCVCVCACTRAHTHSIACSLESNSLWLYGLYPTSLLCPWNFLGKSTGARCHFLLQDILPS